MVMESPDAKGGAASFLWPFSLRGLPLGPRLRGQTCLRGASPDPLNVAPAGSCGPCYQLKVEKVRVRKRNEIAFWLFCLLS